MIGDYKKLISKFLKKGYSFRTFNTFNKKVSGQIILRHDIDFDCGLAENLAIIENDLGVRSTFFFLISNDNYNLLSLKNKTIVKRIIELGHIVSLHYDPTIYDDFLRGFNHEKKIFESEFNVDVDTISLHRPSKEILQKISEQKFNVKTTYDKSLFETIKYFSDSTGEFRFGNPVHSQEFILEKNIQLLIHPVWWTLKGKNKNKMVNSIKELWLDHNENKLVNSLNFYGK